MPPRRSSSARARYRRRVKEAMKRADEAFRGEYAEEMNGLLGLSRAQIDEITPDSTDLQTYDQLVEVVKEASRVNIEQAELVNRIEAMGDVAVSIAKRVPKLAALFV
jgi:hypothetical protein